MSHTVRVTDLGTLRDLPGETGRCCLEAYTYPDKQRVNVCVLAHLLERYLEKKLHGKGIKIMTAEALKHLSRIRSAHIEIKGATYRLRSEASPEAVTIFQALGYRIPPRIELLAKDDRDAKTGASRAQNALV